MLANIKTFFSKNFSALRHHNFRIFWFCQSVSLIGSWMQTISLPWLAYSKTNSAFFVGLIGALQFLPTIFFSLFAGVIIDRFNKKNLILITQSVLTILSLILALLVISDTVKFWHIIVITFLIGVANSLDLPSRQSFMIELVGKDELMNGIALNSSIFNFARIFGPAAAGILMGLIGIGYCFLINFISFIPVIIGLIFFIRPAFSYKKLDENNILQNIIDGLIYIRHHRLILTTLISVLIMGTFAMNFTVLVPVFSREVLNVEEAKFGLLMSFMGVGSFIGSLIIASRSKKGPNELFLIVCAIIVIVFLALIGFSNIYIVSAILLGITGTFTVMFFTTANTLLQLNSKDEFRGRVISVYTLFFAGTTPIGNLFTGAISQNFGIRYGFIINSLIIFILTAAFIIIKTIVSKKTGN